jgi:hypothetical protein
MLAISAATLFAVATMSAVALVITPRQDDAPIALATPPEPPVFIRPHSFVRTTPPIPHRRPWHSKKRRLLAARCR